MKLFLKYGRKEMEITERTGSFDHGEFRQENFDLSVSEYTTSILYKACRIGSIVIIETKTCDILIYTAPGRSDVFMTRVNHKKLVTVYNPNKLQSVPRSVVTGVYCGWEGIEMLTEIVKVNEFLRPLNIVLDLEDLTRAVRFELVVK